MPAALSVVSLVDPEPSVFGFDRAEAYEAPTRRSVPGNGPILVRIGPLDVGSRRDRADPIASATGSHLAIAPATLPET